MTSKLISVPLLVVWLVVATWYSPAFAEALPGANASGTGLDVPAESLTAGNLNLAIAKSTLPGYTIRRTVPEVRIQFTVADDRGRLLQSLSRDDFRILDNRAAVPQIRNFTRLNDLPLQVGILLDVSDSVQKTSARQRQAAQFFIQHVLHRQTDRAALLAFSNEMKLLQPSTHDPEVLSQALAKVHQPGFATYLYDNVYGACQEQFPSSPESDYSQRILVLITDGNDTGSLRSLADVISAAQRREIQIFALSIHSARIIADGDTTVRQLADATGGQFFVASSEKDFPSIFNAMEQQMRTQYSVSFHPAEQSPGFHAVKVEIAGGEKLQVHARQG